MNVITVLPKTDEVVAFIKIPGNKKSPREKGLMISGISDDGSKVFRGCLDGFQRIGSLVFSKDWCPLVCQEKEIEVDRY